MEIPKTKSEKERYILDKLQTLSKHASFVSYRKGNVWENDRTVTVRGCIRAESFLDVITEALYGKRWYMVSHDAEKKEAVRTVERRMIEKGIVRLSKSRKSERRQ